MALLNVARYPSLTDKDREFVDIIAKLQKKVRDLVIMFAVMAFIVGLVVGSVVMY